MPGPVQMLGTQREISIDRWDILEVLVCDHHISISTPINLKKGRGIKHTLMIRSRYRPFVLLVIVLNFQRGLPTPTPS